MEFIPALDTFHQDQAAKIIWGHLSGILKTTDGICYYKHPIISSVSSVPPDFSLLAEGYEPVAIKSVSCGLEVIEDVKRTVWKISGQETDSPILMLEDFIIGLRNKFDRQRILRRLLNPIGMLVLPLIGRKEFERKFGRVEDLIPPNEKIEFVWNDLGFEDSLKKTKKRLEGRSWSLAKSVFQGANPLNKAITDISEDASKIGGAIQILEREIALLDSEQHKVAVQMAPGPQRVRGLAGTGKTVVLAMKAANIHFHYPDKRILFTFHTQSLYNQAKTLISKFYRDNSDSDPDWEGFLHVRHGWGSRGRPGVYYDLCKRLELTPYTLQSARARNSSWPFQACCQQVLEYKIKPFYDFILVDEAQDFPPEFFRVLANLVKSESRQIYFAYDELQSLTSLEIPRAEDLFGLDHNGNPFISLEGEYPGGIEKDFVLHKSYRCPRDILMLAHGIGLGIHGPKGCVQMLANRTSWESVGYEVKEGEFRTNDQMVIYRPEENSPNRIKEIYRGGKGIIEVSLFDTRNEELDYVAKSIVDDITVENIRPEHIVVISLDSRRAKDYLLGLQGRLYEDNIASTIPGLADGSWEFAEQGRVTLSTVYRAKGNEAPVVYIISFDVLYSYAEEIESRNRAFTSISRAKGWLRISGAGKQMLSVKKEIDKLMKDIPCLKFQFPDMENIRIRRLDASETSRRRREVSRARQSLEALLGVDSEALTDLEPKLLEKLKRRLDDLGDED